MTNLHPLIRADSLNHTVIPAVNAKRRKFVMGGEEPYDMRVDKYDAQVDPVLRIALSWSISSIYMALLAVLLIVSVGVLRAA